MIDKGKTYQIVTTFKKSLGEQTSYEEPPTPIRKHRRKKRIKIPSDTEEEKSIRRTFVRQEEEEEKEKRIPRIYTEEIEVRLHHKLCLFFLLFYLNSNKEH